MAGRAYNPGGWEPELHGTFATPSQEVMDKWYAERFTKVLNHYKYEQMYDIYAGIEDELFEGAIDTHLHIYPDYVPRSIDMIQYAIDASRAKMRAVVYKEHFFTNVHAAWAVQYIIDDMVRRGELDHAVKVFGTINLAFSHHPDQVRLISKYPNVGAIFFYTFTGWPEAERRRAGPVLPITDDGGELLPEIKEILQLAAENGVVEDQGADAGLGDAAGRAADDAVELHVAAGRGDCADGLSEISRSAEGEFADLDRVADRCVAVEGDGVEDRAGRDAIGGQGAGGGGAVEAEDQIAGADGA